MKARPPILTTMLRRVMVMATVTRRRMKRTLTVRAVLHHLHHAANVIRRMIPILMLMWIHHPLSWQKPRP